MALSPSVKRWGIIGVASVLLVSVAYILTGRVEQVKQRGPDEIAFEGVLVPGDTRQTSLEGMAAQLREAQDRIDRLERANRDRQRIQSNTVSGQLERLRRELLNADDAQKAELRKEIAALEAAQRLADNRSVGRQLRGAGSDQTPADAEPAPDIDAAKAPDASTQAVLRDETPEPEPAIYTSRPLGVDRDPDDETALVEEVFGGVRTQSNTSTLQPGAGRAGGTSSARQIRRVSNDPVRDAAHRGNPGGTEVQLPAGSILTGVLLNGLDAPAGSQSSRDPLPVLVRIKHEAILPSHFSADLSECFVLLAVHGELSSERAMMRGEELSCIMRDGTVVQQKLAAYAVGEDGRVGLRGRIVSKQGAFLGNAIIVGTLQAAADAVSQGTDVAIGAGTGGGLTSSVNVGAGNALDRIAEWYLERADELFPVVEIDPGRRIDLVLTTGMTFRVEL